MGKEALAMSRYFENELIEQIKDANDIVSVVSEHVALKKRGKMCIRDRVNILLHGIHWENKVIGLSL